MFFKDRDSIINTKILLSLKNDYGYTFVKIYYLLKCLCKKVFPFAIKMKYSDEVFKIIKKFYEFKFIINNDKNFSIFLRETMLRIFKKYDRKLINKVNVTIKDVKFDDYLKYERNLVMDYLLEIGLMPKSQYDNLILSKYPVKGIIGAGYISKIDYVVSKYTKVNFIKRITETEEESNKIKYNYIKNILFKNSWEVKKEDRNLFENIFGITQENVSVYFMQNLANTAAKYQIRLIPLLFKEIFNNEFFRNNFNGIQQLLNDFSQFISVSGYTVNNCSVISNMSKIIRLLITKAQDLKLEDVNNYLLPYYIKYFLNYPCNLILKGDILNYTPPPLNYFSIFRIKKYYFFCCQFKNDFIYSAVEHSKDIEFLYKVFAENSNNNRSTLFYSVQELNTYEENLKRFAFKMQDFFINRNVNMVPMIKRILLSNNSFVEYLDSKIENYNDIFSISKNEMLNCLFINSENIILNKKINRRNQKRKQPKNLFNMVSKEDYREKFIRKIYFSPYFNFNFYNGKESVFYFMPSGELNKIPVENMPILFNLPILRIYNPFYIWADNNKNVMAYTPLERKDLFYILDPAGDLPDTYNEMKPFYDSIKLKGKSHKDEPKFEKIKEDFQKSKIYIYNGHGDGTQIIPFNYVKENNINPIALLLGCSSVMNRISTGRDLCSMCLINYYVANNSPLVLGFSWKVTSKDAMNLGKDIILNLFNESNDEIVSMTDCVLRGKRSIKRRFMNGFSMVAYGCRDILFKVKKN